MSSDKLIIESPSTPMHLDPRGVRQMMKNMHVRNDSTELGIYTLEEMVKLIKSTENLIHKLNKDVTRSNLDRQVTAFEYAKSKLSKLYDVGSKGEQQLRDTIRKLNHKINYDGIEHTARTSPFALEVRQIFRGMDKKSGKAFLNKAIKKEEYEIAECVLGAPLCITGLEVKDHKNLKDKLIDAKFSELTNEIEAITEVADSIGNLAGYFTRYVEGLKTDEVVEGLKHRKEVNEAMSV